ncbi:cupredoxin domain-containing protein [Corynebacterium sp. A21]|uniref:cupredoxin domain-containing protein n=1 Tax=Corynebacterium sp. A21 TaxID=3457318 RepID=UPI003FD31720
MSENQPATPTPTELGATGSGSTSKWSRRTWHRKASRPVSIWLAVLVFAGLIHPIIPEYRWALIHLFTLGAVTNSILIWSQHFSEKFLGNRLPDEARPAQLWRIRILNVGIVITLAGQLLKAAWEQSWLITQVGSMLVALILLWHAVSLARQLRRAEPGRRFRAAVVAYVLSALSLPVGALFGAILATEPAGGWHERLLFAHLVANLLGFLGLAAIGSLVVLFPAIWRTRGGTDRTGTVVALAAGGVVVATLAALLDQGMIFGVGLLIYVAGWILAGWGWVGNIIAVAKDPRDRIGFAAASVACAPLWLVGTLIYLAVQAFTAGAQLHEVALPSIPLLVGFAGQLLIGVMSHLLPSTIGGGAGPLRAATAELNRAGLFRVTLVNGGLVFWLLAENSWLKISMSLLSIGSLVVFLPLLARGIRVQAQVLRGARQAPPAPVDPRPRGNQITAALAVLALILGAFGGLGGPPDPVSAQRPAPAAEQVTEVEVVAGDMVFEPAQVTVPAGNQLIIHLRNEDTLAHDLRLGNGIRSGRLVPGQERRIDAGIITAELAGWCTIAGHHTRGMTFDILVG